MKRATHRFALPLLASMTALSLTLSCTGRDDTGAAARAAHGARPVEAGRVSALADSGIPAGKLGVSIRRGHALLAATRDSLPAHVGNKLRCASCHLDDGRRASALPLIGVYGRFPQYRSRSDAINLIEDRINDCFERSMNGTALRYDSQEMRDMVAYMAFLSRGVAVDLDAAARRLPAKQSLVGDTARGALVFAENCVRCHGVHGEGTAVATPLWGAGSFNIGAGMARTRTAASFIKNNMPYGSPTLTDQQAADVASYVDSRPRPDFPGKEKDWPRGDAPPDVAYRTLAADAKAHATTRP